MRPIKLSAQSSLYIALCGTIMPWDLQHKVSVRSQGLGNAIQAMLSLTGSHQGFEPASTSQSDTFFSCF